MVAGSADNTSRSANIVRASSPPEATFDNGAGGLPAFIDTRRCDVVARVGTHTALDHRTGQRQAGAGAR